MRTSSFAAAFAAGAFLLLASQPQAQSTHGAQPASTYTVVAGDDVPGIVKKLKYPDVTESQMYYGVVKANINTFSVNTVERVLPGMQLKVPSQAAIRKVDVKTADTYMASLRKAEMIYQEGVAAEQKGDMKLAVEKYLAAAKIGHAFASTKLGQLYDKGVTKTLPHDLQESIAHYQEARVGAKRSRARPAGRRI